MKKSSTKKTSQPRKLVLRREAIALLTLPQLTNVVGGFVDDGGGGNCTYFSGCRSGVG